MASRANYLEGENMNIKTRYISLPALGLALLILTGCEAAEQSAQELFDETVEKTTEAARELVNETLADAMEQMNETIDGVQDDVDKTLGKPEKEEPQTEQEADEPTQPQKARTHEA